MFSAIFSFLLFAFFAACSALGEENRARARSKRITTVGGRHEEDIDSAPFLASAASADAGAASRLSSDTMPAIGGDHRVVDGRPQLDRRDGLGVRERGTGRAVDLGCAAH